VIELVDIVSVIVVNWNVLKKKPVCLEHCVVEQLKHCFYIRLPPKYRTECMDVIKKSFINTCLEKCVNQKYVYYTATL